MFIFFRKRPIKISVIENGLEFSGEHIAAEISQNSIPLMSIKVNQKNIKADKNIGLIIK